MSKETQDAAEARERAAYAEKEWRRRVVSCASYVMPALLSKYPTVETIKGETGGALAKAALQFADNYLRVTDQYKKDGRLS